METVLFWKAMVITTVIFIIGIFLGYYIDHASTTTIKTSIESMTINMNDAVLQSLYFQTFANSSGFCDAATDSNLEFADKIYQEGLDIERREQANRFSPELVFEKRRYILLKLQFWLNAIKLKEMCKANYDTVTYFYEDNSTKYNVDLDQKTQSGILLDLKYRCGKSMMLIPIATDLDLSSVDAITKQYGIEKTPSIIINEKTKLDGVQKISDLKPHIKACEEI